MPRPLPSVLPSRVVPTEYDVTCGHLTFVTHSLISRQKVLIPVPLTHRVVLTDDRGRRFSGRTLAKALVRADRAQDPTDPIHHPPYPSPEEAPLP